MAFLALAFRAAMVEPDMTLQTYISAYPWDLMDEGIDDVLDRLQGEIGVSGVAVWAVGPPCTQFRVRDVEPRVIRTGGGLFFKPEAVHYAATRCKPLTSDWSKSHDPLPRIAEACDQRNLKLRLIVSAAATGRLAQRHPEMACKNAFGAVSPTGVCLANPDVQAYLCGLVADLSTKFSPAAVILEDFHIACTDAFDRRLYSAVALGGVERWLLSLCFCESCGQQAMAASVDPLAARNAAAAMVQKSLDNGKPSRHEVRSILADNTALREAQQRRSAALSDLLALLARAGNSPLVIKRAAEPTIGFGDLEDIDISPASAVMTPIVHPNELDQEPSLSAKCHEWALSESIIMHGDGSALVTTLDKAAQLGLAAVAMDHYGGFPEKVLMAITQAVRFARRTSQD